MNELVRLLRQLDHGRNSQIRSEARGQLRRYARESSTNLVELVETMFTFLRGTRGSSDRVERLFSELLTEFLNLAPSRVQQDLVGNIGMRELDRGRESFVYALWDSFVAAGLVTEVLGKQAERFRQATRSSNTPGVVQDGDSVIVIRAQGRGRVFRVPNNLITPHPMAATDEPPTEDRLRFAHWIAAAFLRNQVELRGSTVTESVDSGVMRSVIDELAAERWSLLNRVHQESRYSITQVKEYETQVLDEIRRFDPQSFDRLDRVSVWFMPVRGNPELEARFPGPGLVSSAEIRGNWGPLCYISSDPADTQISYTRSWVESLNEGELLVWSLITLRALFDLVCSGPIRTVQPRTGEESGVGSNPFNTFRRYLARQRTDRNEEGTRVGGPKKRHHVEAFPRTLPPGKRPSRTAIQLAASLNPPVHLRPGETIVSAHWRGGRQNLSNRKELHHRPEDDDESD